ncbi:hypothetical protein P4H83_17185 [Paenibacillus favisporus]|uniref:hypothetical protein n=1 Tax=Paenibacillus TaxID=44249 RepID=UPI001642F1FD|nr:MULTISPECIES: hypothetical protein [Paenibacillus]MEC0176610.1 hypothetical protein [Paenibacillus favisporus]
MGYVDERNAIAQGGWTTEAQVPRREWTNEERLSWLINDTYGVGIALLAGIETKRHRTYHASLQEPAKGAAAHAE